ncbi:MAG TPA: hypothetical protein VM367_00540 [Pseudonocardia sp.]|nr:hypothetical protein [Pseudonocardia sp.]
MHNSCRPVAAGGSGWLVTVLAPGPADLTAMGGNLMNPRWRARVLEVSAETSAAALAAVDAGPEAA